MQGQDKGKHLARKLASRYQQGRIKSHDLAGKKATTFKALLQSFKGQIESHFPVEADQPWTSPQVTRAYTQLGWLYTTAAEAVVGRKRPYRRRNCTPIGHKAELLRQHLCRLRSHLRRKGADHRDPFVQAQLERLTQFTWEEGKLTQIRELLTPESGEAQRERALELIQQSCVSLWKITRAAQRERETDQLRRARQRNSAFWQPGKLGAWVTSVMDRYQSNTLVEGVFRTPTCYTEAALHVSN